MPTEVYFTFYSSNNMLILQNTGFVVAVELGNVAKVKTFLETTDVDINR